MPTNVNYYIEDGMLTAEVGAHSVSVPLVPIAQAMMRRREYVDIAFSDEELKTLSRMGPEVGGKIAKGIKKKVAKVAKVAKKIANSKLVKLVAKGAKFVVPGAALAIAAVKTGAKVAAKAKGGDKKSQQTAVAAKAIANGKVDKKHAPQIAKKIGVPVATLRATAVAHRVANSAAKGNPKAKAAQRAGVTLAKVDAVNQRQAAASPATASAPAAQQSYIEEPESAAISPEPDYGAEEEAPAEEYASEEEAPADEEAPAEEEYAESGELEDGGSEEVGDPDSFESELGAVSAKPKKTAAKKNAVKAAPKKGATSASTTAKPTAGKPGVARTTTFTTSRGNRYQVTLKRV